MSSPEGFPEPGGRIGPYEIVRRIGMGGMGVVFEAVDVVLRRRVALKVISPHLAGDPAFRVRFTQEAQAQASLDSPHVVAVFAHGEADGSLYIASQLIPDGDLGALVRRSGPLPPSTALELIAQVATGLADAHATGLVHRDIKPANVLVRTRGREVSAYLADFGIARRADVDTARGRFSSPPGCVVGTPGYLAPELHAGGTAGATTDVYALGCVLWTALVGRAPYPGTTDAQLAAAHASAAIPQVAAGGPFEREVNRILRTALAKHPRDRYPSAAALRDDLRQVLRSATAPASVQPLRGGLVLALAALVVVAAGVVFLRSGDDEDADVRTAADTIAAALVADADLSETEADCTARRLVMGTGVEALLEQGVLDEDLNLVAETGTGVDPQLLAFIMSAGVACVLEPVDPDGRPSRRRAAPGRRPWRCTGCRRGRGRWPRSGCSTGCRCR